MFIVQATCFPGLEKRTRNLSFFFVHFLTLYHCASEGPYCRKTLEKDGSDTDKHASLLAAVRSSVVSMSLTFIVV
jgi:hypothetical protein